MTLFRKIKTSINKLSPKTGRKKSNTNRNSVYQNNDQSFSSLNESFHTIEDNIEKKTVSTTTEKEGSPIHTKINQNLSLSLAINDNEVLKDIITYNCFEDIKETNNKNNSLQPNNEINKLPEKNKISDRKEVINDNETDNNVIINDKKSENNEVININESDKFSIIKNNSKLKIGNYSNIKNSNDKNNNGNPEMKEENPKELNDLRESNVENINILSLDKTKGEDFDLSNEIEIKEHNNKIDKNNIILKNSENKTIKKENSKEALKNKNDEIKIIENLPEKSESKSIEKNDKKRNNKKFELTENNKENLLSYDKDINQNMNNEEKHQMKREDIIESNNNNNTKNVNDFELKKELEKEYNNSLKNIDLTIVHKNIPIANNNIEGSSHFTLVINNKQLYKSTIKFYVNLGFNIEPLQSKYNYKHEFEATTWEDNHYTKTLVEYSEDEHTIFDEETWLVLENENGKVKLRIVENLRKDFAVADFSQVSDEKLHKLLLEHTSLENAYMTFSAKLDEIENKFKMMKRPYKILKSPILGTDLIYKQIYTYDPLLNLLEFHDKSKYEKLVNINENLEQQKKKDISNQKPEKKIAIMTSGKEVSGMNAAIRALVRCSLTEKITPYIVFNGFKGLVKGDHSIKKAGWEDVRDLLPLGGTVLDTSDCSYISTRENRLKAAQNLFEQGIKYLIIIGDNESFSYAEILQNEWNDLIHELIKNNFIKCSFSDNMTYSLSIIALPATIDNDIAMTDLTLGTCTSLERICEALDSLESTATSHQRCFIIKVVGKRCGWLALMAAIAIGADCTFIPECPLHSKKILILLGKKKCKREKGNRKNIIVVSEGATDKNLNPITATYIKEVIEKNLKIDTRITTLGHIQREGIPCAFDRFLATVQAAEIIKEVLNAKENDTMSILIGIRNNMLTKIPLSESVKLTMSISEGIANKEFDKVLNLRDQEFRASYNAYMESTLFSSDAKQLDVENRLRIGIIHVGSPAGGMNAATRAAVRLCLNRGHTPVGIFNGFSGLVNGEVKPLTWQEVSGWTTIGGSKLGVNRSQPTPVLNSRKLYKKYKNDTTELIDIGLIAYHLQEQNIQGLLIIGGYEAYCSLYTLYEAKSIYPSLCIPMVQIAATVSNNIPGTDYSIGSDTALNTIVQACDHIKLSASASQRRVFIVEVQGGNCGYLSTMGGLACGVTCTYGPENGISLSKLKNDIRHLTRRYKEAELKGIKNEGRIIIRNEFTNSSTYSTKVISAILNEEGKGLFDSKTAILGPLQQGGIPSPLDRIRAVRQAVECINWLEKKTKENKKISSYRKYLKVSKTDELPKKVDKEAYVIGIRGDKLEFTQVNELIKETNIDLRKTSHNWWMKYYPLIKILSKYYYFDVNDETDIDYLTNEKNI
ncbi:PFK-domain-containing protein [Neocallimastix californiae]|uniref:6-phosphofructokinase n=1 Tax=Neocallimastix californiae TaxID=1754190 RepID=A0A1Y2DJM5_9FUNG|nr:PFK-domain-containing protein [Neocallimastix californiae]|eukprot:ORY59356.1 PFK-domain-containing protein [Neocallimastix californiae]